MDTKEIISSGLLELYAAGLTSEKETLDVEQWIDEYPEVAAELQEITASLESYAHANGLQPGEEVKDRIFARVKEEQLAKVIPLPARGDLKVVMPFWKMIAAAAILLLTGSIVLNIITYNKYTETGKDLITAKQELDSLEEENSQMAANMNVVQSKYSVPVALKGLEAAPEAAAKIFWMQNTGEVFIDPSNLPDVPAGKYYQLWAIVDGKPVDGGMILISGKGDKYRIQKMKSFGKAEAFAVTLESEKDNPAPKGPMFVMGKM